MIRDMAGRPVLYSDPRVMSRRRARSFQGRIAAPKHTCSVWPTLAPYSCLSCRIEHVGDPRRAGFGPRHDPHYCATLCERRRTDRC